MRLLLSTVVILIATLPTLAWSMGADYATDQPVNGSPNWPIGLKELVNVPHRVFGYGRDYRRDAGALHDLAAVKWVDVFFFAGDTEKLNAALQDYQRLPNTKLQLVLHLGVGEAKSPGAKEPRKIAADWKLDTTPLTREQIEKLTGEKDAKLPPGTFTAQLDVWTGGQIDLEKLRVPAIIFVEAGDDAQKDVQIQKFSFRHRKDHAEAEEEFRKKQTDADEHARWIAKALAEIQTVKPGMTRAELLKVFQVEGGLSTRTERRYAYHGCPYLKVDVKFEVVGEPDAKVGLESSKDKIRSISQPFLEWPIGD